MKAKELLVELDPSKLGFPRAHLPIVYLRYILHVFSYMVNNMLALTIFLILFSFCLNLFCLALCTCLKGMRIPKGENSPVLGGNFYIFMNDALLSE
uniref:Gephyrin n=3 Tax=Macaca TaxID=9539 RepID=A0A5F7ZD04_MACMU